MLVIASIQSQNEGGPRGGAAHETTGSTAQNQRGNRSQGDAKHPSSNSSQQQAAMGKAPARPPTTEGSGSKEELEYELSTGSARPLQPPRVSPLSPPPAPQMATDLAQENAELRRQLAELTRYILQQQSVTPNLPLLSTEPQTQPFTQVRVAQQERSTPPPAHVPTPFQNKFINPQRLYRQRFSKMTPEIKPLSDGENPTFQQWRASIQDRLILNADHFPTERARMAEVWGYTRGLARDIIEPQYVDDSGSNTFSDAEAIINLLGECFV
ncbi:hypothetical protein DM02DRAFT_620508 [Periconia macrospinosa]|uniref:Uncharacterized protein n=1 Tax=Periconia macrospinosa TaxID=97972 RepID=A0A2V1D0E4_9PLEO|nr:hypothetical protein DM02DRAFT_620508 [Periconia macrospinosa]